ncbi:YesL family protein [Acutalibacter caecimuris]|uniref:YesL family protein n=1 Tax=Acutalibacter caecimuris TaxID=3093657 RepID=UPI002AC95F28|nr:YesL family protein [Acutalibacter sp. M00118]
MAFLGLFGNYDKPGPGVSKDEPPKAAPVRFFEVLLRKFSKLVQLNLIFVLPTLVAIVLMVLIYLFPTHFVIQIAGVTQIDGWASFVVPIPLILLTPFSAGLTIVTRNFSREEHAFVWSDFWEAVKTNWKYFLLNGFIGYTVYIILGFSIIYYYNMAIAQWLYYIPLWMCVVVAVVFLFAQYYLPVMFVTFDLKFTHAYKNALIFTVAGFGRNILLTIILAGLMILMLNLPLLNITLLAYALLLLFFLFSFISYLVNFTVYPIIDRYLIQPYQRMQEEKDSDFATPVPAEEEFAGLFTQVEEEIDEDKYVYVNGKLVKQSELKKGERKLEE